MVSTILFVPLGYWSQYMLVWTVRITLSAYKSIDLNIPLNQSQSGDQHSSTEWLTRIFYIGTTLLFIAIITYTRATSTWCWWGRLATGIISTYYDRDCFSISKLGTPKILNTYTASVSAIWSKTFNQYDTCSILGLEVLMNAVSDYILVE